MSCWPSDQQPLPLFHVVAKDLPDELAHGAALLAHHALHLLGHLRRQGEGDRLGVPRDEPVAHNLSYSVIGHPLIHCQEGGIAVCSISHLNNSTLVLSPVIIYYQFEIAPCT